MVILQWLGKRLPLSNPSWNSNICPKIKKNNYGIPQKNRLSLNFKKSRVSLHAVKVIIKYFIAFHAGLSWEKFIIIHLIETFPLYGSENFISVVAAYLVSTLVISPEPPLAASFSRGKPSAKAMSPAVGLRTTAPPLAHEESLPAANEILSREVAIYKS